MATGSRKYYAQIPLKYYMLGLIAHIPLKYFILCNPICIYSIKILSIRPSVAFVRHIILVLVFISFYLKGFS